MPLSVCLGCGEPADGTRCPECKAEHERTTGQGSGRPRVKLTSLEELLRIGHG